MTNYKKSYFEFFLTRDEEDFKIQVNGWTILLFTLSVFPYFIIAFELLCYIFSPPNNPFVGGSYPLDKTILLILTISFCFFSSYYCWVRRKLSTTITTIILLCSYILTAFGVNEIFSIKINYILHIVFLLTIIAGALCGAYNRDKNSKNETAYIERLKNIVNIKIMHLFIFLCVTILILAAVLDSLHEKKFFNKFSESRARVVIVQKIAKGQDSSNFSREELAEYFDNELVYERAVRYYLEHNYSEEHINANNYRRQHQAPEPLQSTSP